MPYKFNADHRDKIPKQKHRVTNWSTYNEGLRQRGDLTVWVAKTRLICGRRHAERREAGSDATLIWGLKLA